MDHDNAALKISETTCDASNACNVISSHHVSYAGDVAHDDLAVLYDGDRRSLALERRAKQEVLPKLRALVRGRVWDSNSMSREQAQYAIKTAEATIASHPCYCAAMLADEPADGETANCIFQTFEIVILITSAMLTSTPPKEGERRAKLVALQKLREQLAADGALKLAVTGLVQVAPVGNDRRLTVEYGNSYIRDYDRGGPPTQVLYATEDDVWDLLRSHGLEGDAAVHALLCCGVPLDDATVALARAAVNTVALPPVLRRSTKATTQGALTVPELMPVPSSTAAAATDAADVAQMAVLSNTVAVTVQGSLDERNDMSFVSVLVHDGTNMVGIRTTSAVTMGRISDELAGIAGKPDRNVFWGLYAAQLALRLRLGAVWEYPELGVTRHSLKLLGASTTTGKKKKRDGNMTVQHTAWYELVLPRPLQELWGALEKCFAERNPTPGDALTYVQLEVLSAGDIPSIARDSAVMQGILSGNDRDENLHLRAVTPNRLEVPRRVSSVEMERDDPAYDPALLTGSYESRSFYDIENMLTTFYPIPPEAGEPESLQVGRTRPVSWSNLGAAKPSGVTDDEDMPNPDARATAAGDSGEEDGQTAHYAMNSVKPRTDNVSAFMAGLNAGMPRDIVAQLREEQSIDPFCRRMKEQLQELRAYQEIKSVTSELTAGADGRVKLQLQVRGGIDESTKAGRKRFEKLWSAATAFHVGGNGMLYHIGEDRMGRAKLEYVVPPRFRTMLVAAAHDGMLHLGRARTVDALAASGMWWDTRSKDVKRYIKGCGTCARNKLQRRQGEMHIPPDGGKPWQVASVDIVHLEETSSGFNKAVIFSDRFSRAIRAFPCTEELDSRAFLNIVAFELIPDVGCPLLMLSDHHSILISRLCEEFYEEFGGIDPRIADAHMHTAVATCERFNSTLREMARAGGHDNATEWDLLLPYLVMFYNATVHDSHGFSPFYIEHGREPRLPRRAHAADENYGNVSDYTRSQLLGLHLVWEVCQCKLKSNEQARKGEHDAKYATNVAYGPGDRVLVLQPGRVHKMEMPYVGPYRVLWGPDDRDRYALRDVHGRRFNEFHVSKLKLWPVDDEIEGEYYVVYKILDHHDTVFGRNYLIHWQGYTKAQATWEPASNLESEAAKEAAEDYDKGILDFDAAAALSHANLKAKAAAERAKQEHKQMKKDMSAKSKTKQSKQGDSDVDKTSGGWFTAGDTGDGKAEREARRLARAEERDKRNAAAAAVNGDEQA